MYFIKITFSKIFFRVLFRNEDYFRVAQNMCLISLEFAIKVYFLAPFIELFDILSYFAY